LVAKKTGRGKLDKVASKAGFVGRLTFDRFWLGWLNTDERNAQKRSSKVLRVS
jgi:hypothetical protein